MNDEDRIEANILDLPNEILLYICSYLDSIFIFDCLKKVCRRFENIINDEYVWRHRSGVIYPNTTILFPESETKLDNEDKPWSRMVYEVETNRKFFRDAKDWNCSHMQTLQLKYVHISTVNELKLVCDNRLCISVSRDRTIGVWNMDAPVGSLVKHIDQAHEGWVWCVDDCDGQTFCTGAWDSKFKLWSIENFTNISSYKCDASVLSLSCRNSLIAAGLLNSKLVLHDSRIKHQCTPLLEHKLERKGVIQGVSLEDNNVYVASVNGVVSCYDMRAKQVVKSTESLTAQYHKIVSYSYRNGTIIIGDTMSTLTVLNRDLSVEAKTTVELENPQEQRKIVCIKQNDYDMFVGTRDFLSSFLKSDPIIPIDSIQSSKYEMTAIDYDFNNVLLHSSDEQGAIIMHKKLYNEISL